MTTLQYQEAGVSGTTAIKSDSDPAQGSKVEVVEIVGPGPNFYQMGVDSLGRITVAGLDAATAATGAAAPANALQVGGTTTDPYPLIKPLPLTPQGRAVSVSPTQDANTQPFAADLAARLDATNSLLNVIAGLLADLANKPNPATSA